MSTRYVNSLCQARDPAFPASLYRMYTLLVFLLVGSNASCGCSLSCRVHHALHLVSLAVPCRMQCNQAIRTEECSVPCSPGVPAPHKSRAILHPTSGKARSNASCAPLDCLHNAMLHASTPTIGLQAVATSCRATRKRRTKAVKPARNWDMST